ncbi:hypothetical protein HUZ36_11040 [Pseudoalteromonas sp. McH1-7]|uniref:Lipoprotein n=1 Tax=Pseudoalteromonas peptidolytica F12-50-A1 TaxID=1315280 RepID=A0A8I0MTP7_9GAMM|nr:MULTISPECIES: hypothetical protein [Pseudoalteromonas]MBE0345667.1 hypothetical protein [Pseudoalteromonas peptidolytica F12-50-A1]MDW7547756.1 hypothetical protein [Pseudoalteromonas peptidolytica]NLR14290.1 hypothetical protein [Pseudoalteromonas peptidolytica]NUZ11318.1 hypothetical protein [Pseudoalteromonas sp. McH1-7]RXF03905.1 hypothetical protein D9603_07270 [Pseudoalteromonas sp. PS5]
MKKIIILFTTAFLFACSSTSGTKNDATTASKKSQLECEVSSMTGSKLKRKRCIDKKQAEYEKENARRLTREALNNSSSIATDG